MITPQRMSKLSQSCNALETSLLFGDFEGAIQLARNLKTSTTSRQEYAICLCAEIQALFELGREIEARDIAIRCVVEDGVAFENFSLLNTCVSLFLVVSDDNGLDWAETTFQRWFRLERKSYLSNGERGRFSVKQKKHLWEVLLFHILPQRGLEGIQKGLDKVHNELPEWGFDEEWLSCMERELINRKEALNNDSGPACMEKTEESLDYIPQEHSRSTVVRIGQDESMDSVTEMNDSVWSKTWTIVQQVDSPLFRISIVTTFCLLFYLCKQKFRVKRHTSGTVHHRSWSQGWMDIFRMAFGLSYGRPGI
ncbi:hypothetical protein Gasu2_32890 [Galdieria sulphuraria]|uniref:Uncharacterized protein n=1 Tax=Galdieria sulphuraria TaxID=130081 RepID=M2Y3S3_GALSU|nr:uncharacterized protein Gasu_20790 [Galdieria sulphuraria]EME30618.1 hypothetical protein Gasu_20790 [Galdieria sulphuraria]GJD09016.1 hypothetical protein Gasu2_32890 [Galdieria sulphuraria]|eukprot:XP_005707138.1 hypothetical protein Gasu_20790 [Galdieria sulphuraria]